MENLKTYFQGQKLRVANFYTDSYEDKPMIEFSENAFFYRTNQLIVKVGLDIFHHYKNKPVSF